MTVVDAGSSTFTTHELTRLAAYRAAVAAGFYTDWDGSATSTDVDALAWLATASDAPDGYPFTPHELALAKQILRFGEVIEVVERELKPHVLCSYLYELASRFSGFAENCPVIQSEEPTRSSRLRLCEVTARTLAVGLDLLGIEHPEQM